MIVAETNRLTVKYFDFGDAEFIQCLLNEPSFINNIADKGIKSKNDALQYLKNGPISSYHKNGFGLNMVKLNDGKIPIGMCGLIKRPELEDIDLGYAMLTEHEGKGYAEEAARAVLKNARDVLQIRKIIAVTSPKNIRSIHLLKKLEFQYENNIELYGQDNKLFVLML